MQMQLRYAGAVESSQRNLLIKTISLGGHLLWNQRRDADARFDRAERTVEQTTRVCPILRVVVHNSASW